MQAGLGTVMCKFGSALAICLREEAIFVKSQKCPYHVTFDPDLDLEHSLDAGPSGDHRVRFWWQWGYFCGRRFAICAKFTDRQTDRQPVDGRRAIALAHGMS